jgi:ABC-2 type transport system permease protein
LSALVPASYIFNGMRSVLMLHVVRMDDLMIAAVLDVVWLGIGGSAFLMFHQSARDRGMLLQLGE